MQRTRPSAPWRDDASAKDPLVRNLTLLGLIPRYPKSASVQELRASLKDRGYSVTARTIQRDLAEKLALRFPLLSQEDGPTFRWSFDSQAQINLPASDPATALAMHLAEGHLRHLLPPGALGLLEPQFAEARRHLQALEHNSLTRWAKRVRSLPSGKSLLPANVDGDIWEQVCNALLEQRQLQVDYLSRVKGEIGTLVLHPKGLVSRGPTTYLIADVGDYTDIRHFAMHRIQRATVLPAKARDDAFDMDDYLPMAAFTPRRGVGTVKLIADVHPDIAWILRETPLSAEQTLDVLPRTDWLRLTSRVPDDQETRWWAFGIGEKMKIREPDAWRQETVKRLQEANRLYAS